MPLEEIDRVKVRKAAKQAQISEVIESWNQGYKTLVGERGMRLSGGQQQRIGLARAFYRDSDVLILDEATSALDNETEMEVMNSIEKFNQELTVIMIAHRLTTLRGCDMIVKFKKNNSLEIVQYSEIIGSTK